MNTLKLNAAQIELRNEIYNKKEFVTQKAYTLKDIATAISDTSAPLSIKVKRNEEIVGLKPLYVDETGIIGVEQSYKPIMRTTRTIKSIFVESVKYLYNQTYLMILSLIITMPGIRLWHGAAGTISMENTILK